MAYITKKLTIGQFVDVIDIMGINDEELKTLPKKASILIDILNDKSLAYSSLLDDAKKQGISKKQFIQALKVLIKGGGVKHA